MTHLNLVIWTCIHFDGQAKPCKHLPQEGSKISNENESDQQLHDVYIVTKLQLVNVMLQQCSSGALA